MSPPQTGEVRGFKEHLNHSVALVENWRRSHLDFLVLVVVAIGFLIRAVAASRTFLNPDEAHQYLLVHQPSLVRVYNWSLTTAHPPFFFFLLYFWRLLGNSELMLRLLSVLAGTAFLWVAFQWLCNVFGKCAGLIGLLLLTFSPTMVSLSAEVRSYPVLLLFLASALYFLERALQENSARKVGVFCLFLYLAILTHYCAAWFTLAVGVYALLRVLSGRLRSQVVWIWLGSQAGAVALYAFLYVTQVSKLRGGFLEQAAVSSWLSTSYFDFGKSNPVVFALDRSLSIFQYDFGHDQAGIAMFILFLLGLAALLAKGGRPEPARPSSRQLGILLGLPFLVGSGAAIARLYPYGGTRHNVYLAPFVVAGASFALAHLPGKKLWPSLLVAVVIMAICNLDPVPDPQDIRPENQSKVLMSEALKDIRQSISSGGLIFVEYQTSLMLRYYLCRDQIFPVDDPHKAVLEFSCGGYRLASSGPSLWVFTGENFAAEFDRLVRQDGLKPGERVWVVRAGWNRWGKSLYSDLATQFPELDHLPHQSFGHNISVFQVVVRPQQKRS